MKLSITIYVVLAVAIVGSWIWAVCTDAKVKAYLAEVGKCLLWTGMLAFLIAISSQVAHC